MHKQIVQVIFACLFAYAMGPASASAQTQPAATAAATTGPSAITPAEAQRAVDILQDEQRRAEVLRTLKAIADSAPASSPAPAAPAATPQVGLASLAGLTATPAATHPAIVPLEQNGLMARMLREVGRWFDGLGVQFGQFEQAVFGLPVLFARDEGGLNNQAARSLLLHTLATLAAVFAAGLALEWGLHHLLRRPRSALVEHAEQAQARERDARENERRRQQYEAEQEQIKKAARPSAEETAADTAAAAGTRPAADNVALVQTHRDGIERVEAVPVGTDNAAGGAAAQEPVHDAAAAASAPVGVPTPAPAAQTVPDGKKQPPAHRNHWYTLRHLPFAAGALLLDLLPLALFFVATGLLLRWFAGDDGRIHDVTIDFVNAYVTARVIMTILRLLVSPVGPSLQVLHLGPYTATLFLTRARRIIVLATFGLTMADALQVLGAGPAARLAFIKVLSLIVHIFVVRLIFRLRRPVGNAIRASEDASGPLAVVRNRLAQVWAFIAAIFVMGAWFVWAMGVEDGFPKLVHFIAISLGILIAARLVAILLLGVSGRIFHVGTPAENGADAAAAVDAVAAAARNRLAERYYAVVRSLISVVTAICAIVALLQAWGLDAIDWFAAGTIGRSLTSAALTIVVSIIVAVFVWEGASFSIERRLELWTRQGDLVRAARLRTLLPMLRTSLFIVVILILGLTALNEIGINTTPMLAGASIIGVALGFGSQKLVQDFITGIFLLMENAMRVGDWVTVAGVSGSVEYLSIRTVRLRGSDGSLYIVPFSSVSTVNNTNRGLGNAAIRVSVAYDTDVERVITELKNIGAALREDPAFRDQILNDIEIWGVDAVDGSMVTLAGQMRCSDAGRWGVQREINRRVLERFREIGIEIANPRASLLLTPAGVPAEHEESKTPAQAPRDGQGGQRAPR